MEKNKKIGFVIGTPLKPTYEADVNPLFASYQRYQLAYDRFTDKDVIEKLNSVPNRTEYIRQLVRKDIKDTQ